MRNILILTTLLLGLIFTSLIKNKTRLLEKELLQLDSEINILNSSLAEATLDFQYLTTPKNISLLARNFLDESFSYYEESQIKKLIVPEKDLVILEKSKNDHTFDKLSTEELVDKKLDVSKKIETQLNKDVFVGEETVKYLAILKKIKNDNIFSQLSTEKPFNINKRSSITEDVDIKQPQELKKTNISKKIYHWTGIQIVKSFFGIPSIPGK